MEWDIENTGGTTYTDCRFIHGGDTYFDGNDNSRGYYNAAVNMVYLKNPNNEDAGIMGLYGHPNSPVDRYHEDYFTTNWNEMDDGELPNTVNGDDLDAGYSVQWNRATLAPGNIWQIVAFEKWTGAGSVQVYAPADEDVSADVVKSYTFAVQNFQTEPATYDLSVSSSNGWATNLPGGSSITLASDEVGNVVVELTVPSAAIIGTTDELTLTATDNGNSGITNNDFVISTVAVSEEVAEDNTDDEDYQCFLEKVLGIAMATDDIIVLRRFRDDNLLTNPVGQVFVATYYKTSSVLVELINCYPVLKNITREILKPIIWFCKGLVE